MTSDLGRSDDAISVTLGNVFVTSRRRATHAILFSCLAGAASCTFKAAPAEAETRDHQVSAALYVDVDRATYRIVDAPDRLFFTLRLTLRNRSTDTIFVRLCGDGLPWFVLERKVDSTWVVGYEAVCLGSREPPLALAAGQSSSSVLTIIQWKGENIYRPFRFADPTGTYRVKVLPFVGYDFKSRQSGTRLPAAEVTAREFVVGRG